MTDLPDEPEAFWALFNDELNDPNALSFEEIQRAMPVHGDTRATMIARNNRNNPKRLTGPELAAEWWKALAVIPALRETGLDIHADRETQIAKTLERFATLPHYDEQDQP